MILTPVTTNVEYKVFFGFCGLGGGAIGFQKGDPRVGHLQARFRTLGGFDVDPRCVRDFSRNVGDPRPQWDRHSNNLSVERWDEPSKTVIAGGKGVQGGWLSIADPRIAKSSERGANYLTAGHYGVVPWNQPSGAVSAAAGPDNGRWNVADPRLPHQDAKLVAIIRSLDDTWHRPFTTYELAALQNLFEPGESFELDGKSDSRWREAIGNCVPPASAKAIADVIGTTLLLSRMGQTFMLSAQPIWVKPLARAISVNVPLPPTELHSFETLND